MTKKKMMYGIIVLLAVAFIAWWIAGRADDTASNERVLKEIRHEDQAIILQFDKGETKPSYHVVELLGDHRIGYVGEQKENLEFLGESIVKIWFTDVTIDDAVIKALGEGTPAKAGEQDVTVYTLSPGITVLISYPPDDSAAVIYFGFTEPKSTLQMGYNAKDSTLQIRYE